MFVDTDELGIDQELDPMSFEGMGDQGAPLAVPKSLSPALS